MYHLTQYIAPRYTYNVETCNSNPITFILFFYPLNLWDLLSETIFMIKLDISGNLACFYSTFFVSWGSDLYLKPVAFALPNLSGALICCLSSSKSSELHA